MENATNRVEIQFPDEQIPERSAVSQAAAGYEQSDVVEVVRSLVFSTE